MFCIWVYWMKVGHHNVVGNGIMSGLCVWYSEDEVCSE